MVLTHRLLRVSGGNYDASSPTDCFCGHSGSHCEARVIVAVRPGADTRSGENSCYGVYQIGDDQARSLTVGGNSSG